MSKDPPWNPPLINRPPRFSPPSSSNWVPPPTSRPLAHSKSSPPSRPSSRTDYIASRQMPMPEPSRPQGYGWSVPGMTQASHEYSNSPYPPPPPYGANQPTEPWQFPDPRIGRSQSHQSSLQLPQVFRPRSHSSTGVHPPMGSHLNLSQPNLRHKYSHSDGQFPSQEVEQDEGGAFERSPSISPSVVSDEFVQTFGLAAEDGLASANGLERFQNGEGDDNDWAWHLLVTVEARESLPESEVLRQSAIFDLINGERSYVSDLKLVQEIFIDGLRQASPPVILPTNLEGFLGEVFWNMNLILSHHQRMLGSLFNRQREQHPILLSIGDIVFDTVLKFRAEYDSYIKHYPLAESCHRRERKSNPNYRAFLEKCSQDPRLGKRDLITFISRPVTRLPRLSLQLLEVKKRTERLGESGAEATKEDHPDLETVPILADILNGFVKSTQPGIEASEGKVKLYTLMDSLKLRNGEIIDLDLFDENRSLVYSGPLGRKQSESWHGWTDLEVVLLDNYFLVTKLSESTGRQDVVSRPIPLEYLRLGPFHGPPENRREERPEGSGLLGTIIKPTRPVFPLVISHAASSARRYTLYANTENVRSKWKESLEGAIGLRKVVDDSNKWFAMYAINASFFRTRTSLVPSLERGLFTGRIASAVSFASLGKTIVVVATHSGVYASVKGQSGPFVRVLALQSVTNMAALQGFNKLLIHNDGSLLAYSLDAVARVVQGQGPHKSLDASLERLASPGRNGAVSFFRVGVIGGRTIVVYACKSLLNYTLYALEVVAEQAAGMLSATQSKPQTFRQYGDTFYVPREPFDAVILAKTIAVCSDRAIFVIDPTNLMGQSPVFIPDFPDHGAGNLETLRAKCENCRPIGIFKCDKDELIVIYDEFGCYVTKYGVPTRRCGFVRWETKAVTYTTRGTHILLFSSRFIEVRHAPTGRLVQVIEGNAIRLAQGQRGGPLLIAKQGKDDRQGLSDELHELLETAPIERTPSTRSNGPGGHKAGNDVQAALWEEWD